MSQTFARIIQQIDSHCLYLSGGVISVAFCGPYVVHGVQLPQSVGLRAQTWTAPRSDMRLLAHVSRREDLWSTIGAVDRGLVSGYRRLGGTCRLHPPRRRWPPTRPHDVSTRSHPHCRGLCSSFLWSRLWWARQVVRAGRQYRSTCPTAQLRSLSRGAALSVLHAVVRLGLGAVLLLLLHRPICSTRSAITGWIRFLVSGPFWALPGYNLRSHSRHLHTAIGVWTPDLRPRPDTRSGSELTELLFWTCMLRAVSTRSVFSSSTSETGRRADFYCQLSSSAAVRTEDVTVKI